MKGSKSRFGIVALVVGAGALGCSHEQKEPPAHPAPAPVAAAPRPPRPPAPPTEVASEPPAPRLEPAIYFDFDSALLRPESHDVLQKIATSMRSRNAAVRIEGNCDELGTIEYNMALGEERARAAQSYLLHLGVPKGRLQTVSYGSQRPKYPGHDDDAHARNRRDDLIVR
jgi:peptidoglycan-associated lipoprotein